MSKIAQINSHWIDLTLSTPSLVKLQSQKSSKVGEKGILAFAFWRLKEAFIKKKCNICHTKVWPPYFSESVLKNQFNFSPILDPFWALLGKFIFPPEITLKNKNLFLFLNNHKWNGWYIPGLTPPPLH